LENFIGKYKKIFIIIIVIIIIIIIIIRLVYYKYKRIIDLDIHSFMQGFVTDILKCMHRNSFKYVKSI